MKSSTKLFGYPHCGKFKIKTRLCCGIVVLSVALVQTLRIVRYSSSSVEYIEALHGSNLTLECRVNLEASDQLYSLKWYKYIDGSYYEFYSYISSPEKTIHQRPLPGIRLEQRESSQPTGELVHLLAVDFESEGAYRCEAISDEMFQLDRKEFNLTVLVPAREAPTIIANRRSFGLGERIHLRCVTGQSRPPSQVRWLINEMPVPETYVSGPSQLGHEPHFHYALAIDHLNQVTHNTSQSKHQKKKVTRTTSDLDFILRREHLNEENRLLVRCVSQLQIETNFYPNEHHTHIDLQVWHPATPVIEGLQAEYQLGDWIDVNCTVPHHKLEDSHIHSLRLQWYINLYPVNPSYVVHYFNNGQIGLRFRLKAYHLDVDESFSIKCSSIQLWPTHQVPQMFNQSSVHHSIIEIQPTRNKSVSNKTRINMQNTTKAKSNGSKVTVKPQTISGTTKSIEIQTFSHNFTTIIDEETNITEFGLNNETIDSINKTKSETQPEQFRKFVPVTAGVILIPLLVIAIVSTF